MELVQAVYSLTATFPAHEQRGLAGQMQRAAVSIPSNIAEGHTLEHTREFLRHISIAQGSLAELQTQAQIASRLGYIAADAANSLEVDASALAKQLYALRNALLRTSRPNSQPLTPDSRHGP